MAGAGRLRSARVGGPGAESLHTSRVVQHLPSAPEGVCAFDRDYLGMSSTPWASQRLLRNTHDCTPKAHTPEDDDTRREPPAAPFPR